MVLAFLVLPEDPEDLDFLNYQVAQEDLSFRNNRSNVFLFSRHSSPLFFTSKSSENEKK
jgi:hypothetical protein